MYCTSTCTVPMCTNRCINFVVVYYTEKKCNPEKQSPQTEKLCLG